jgi:hypothetical protein
LRKFINNFIFLSLPLIIWAIIVFFIDPFNYFRISNLINEDLKIKNARKVNQLLQKSIDFSQTPGQSILVGDSRTELLSVDQIESVSGIKYKSLCNNAAKLNEIIDLIYFANDIKKLKHIVVGVNFNMFNEFSYANRVDNIRKIINNPLKYIYNKNIFQSCYSIVRELITGKGINLIPPMNKEEYWDMTIDSRAFQWYSKYKYPDNLRDALVALDAFCNQEDIQLTFIIVPHNIEFKNRLIEFGLKDEEVKFKSFMGTLWATVIDYDYKNKITMGKEYFTDPVHYNTRVGNMIIDEVWGDKFVFGRKL